ncbi:MAG: NAD(P)/FAD-dependent oxidoreductase [Spirochaetales bacterium]|uniref:NAD(P)/FAD-dependent oxidoreductase n=1 Tax=Candidatus Thalassospirochaeta sargassi TaxID=3119039 RepID=A0AAJ1MIW3_9SPIO|nr:NAD(P)/FAD-dependent oxidoreductase [Spirochaetales bacterium]
MKYSHDLIVIGGGAAGLTLTAGAAQTGVKVVLIEKEHMGGDCLYYGCVPSKALLRSGKLIENLHEINRFGLPQSGIDISADAALLMSNIQQVISNIAYHDSIERFTSLGAEVIFGRSRFINNHELEIESVSGIQRISAPKISISTGSSPLIIPVPGLEETGYLTNKTVFSISKIPAELLVIGGGPIGVEMSYAFSNLGSAVTLLTNTDQLLPHEDPDMARYAENALACSGVKLIFGAEIGQVLNAKGRKQIKYTQNGSAHIQSGEEILVATGRTGNISELQLDNAGIEHNQRFIKTNSTLQTSRKNIMAIGDVNGNFLFTHVAGAEGGIAFRRQVLGLPANMNYARVPWTTYTAPEIASIGLNEKRADKAGIAYRKIEAEFSENDRAQAERETDGKIKILTDKKERVIGVQIAGPHAGELLSPGIFAVNEGWKLSKLYSPMLPYPTLTEIYKKAIGEYMSPKLFNPGVRKFLKIFKGYRGTGPV